MKGEDAAFESFAQKAPLVELPGLRDQIVSRILSDGTRTAADSVWLRKSFVDPEKEIDRKQTDSDLDVFVLLPDWDYPVVDSGLAVAALQAETPEAYADVEQHADWESKDGEWHDPSDAWSRIPSHARETLENSLQLGFFATQQDQSEGNVRLYDVTVVNEYQFNYKRDETAEIRLWNGGSG